MTAPFDPSAVSSMAEVIGTHAGGLTPVPTADLTLWLPDLTTLQGWTEETLDGTSVTRSQVRRLGSGPQWDGCEVLNLYRVPGVVPEHLVMDNADRTLRDSGAEHIEVRRVDIALRYGVIATRASGRLSAGTRTVYSSYHYYVVNTNAGAALIEQAILIGADALPVLEREVAHLTESLHRALLASIDRAAYPAEERSAEGVADWGHAASEARDHPGPPPAFQSSEPSNPSRERGPL